MQVRPGWVLCAMSPLALAGMLWTVAAPGAFGQQEDDRGSGGIGIKGPMSPTCAKDCHAEITARPMLHRPSAERCETCHVQGNPEEHNFFLVTPSREELCRKCHILPRHPVNHPPVAEGKCYECHDPHGSEFPHLLRADPRRDLCTRCHSQTVGQAPFVHGPVALGACVICHRPHGSTEAKLLNADARTMCLSCHPEVQGGPGSHAHKALEEGCTRCHDAHASDHKFQLRELAPKLCLQCHQETFDRMVANAKVVHGAITEEGGCSECHAAHFSSLPGLQKGKQPDTCIGCHSKPTKDADGNELVNMGALLASNHNQHAPIRQGSCTVCHDPHAGERFRLLTEDYPADFYAPFKLENFQLCFGCHIADLVLKEKGRGLTQFRDGDLNLHYLHVNQPKGRTCRACHEVHASKRPFHIREAVPYGSTGWLLEINFQANSTGGACAPGCHAAKTYVRGDTVKPKSGQSSPAPAAPAAAGASSQSERGGQP